MRCNLVYIVVRQLRGELHRGQQRCDVSGRAEGLEECMRPIKYDLQPGATGRKLAG